MSVYRTIGPLVFILHSRTLENMVNLNPFTTEYFIAGIRDLTVIIAIPKCSFMITASFFASIYTLQEMCCVFWLSRERWYRKSVLPSTGAGLVELKIYEKMQKLFFV